MFISITQLHIRSIWSYPALIRHSMRSYKQAMQAEGNQKLLTKIAGGYALTITAWKDEESMKKFKNSGAHKDAMKAMARISDRYRSVHGLMDEVPSWPLAYQKLEEKEFINI